MTIAKDCPVCATPDRRRLIELGWNDGMDAIVLAAMWDELTSKEVLRHLKMHSEGRPSIRAVTVAPVTTARERVANLQRLQLDEVERRIALAMAEADRRNQIVDDLRTMGAEGANELAKHDWSEFFNILDKDVQAAIGSILKSQGITDKRDKAQGDLKLGLFEAMANAGLAPKALIGGVDVKVLPPGDDDDAEA